MVKKCFQTTGQLTRDGSPATKNSSDQSSNLNRFIDKLSDYSAPASCSSQISDFLSQISDFLSQISDLRFWISNLRSQIFYLGSSSPWREAGLMNLQSQKNTRWLGESLKFKYTKIFNTLHYRLKGEIGKKSFFFFNWLAYTHFWLNFDEIFCAGVKP